MLNTINELIANADDPAPEIEGDVKEAVEETEDVVTDVDNSSGEKDVDGEAVVKALQQKVGITTADKEIEGQGDDIPDAFTNACLTQGWSEDEIKEFASGLDNATLLELIPEIIEHKEDVPVKTEVKEEKTTTAVKAEDTTTNKEIAELKAAYDKRIAELEAKFSEADKVKSTKDTEAMILTINQVFDEASKSFEIFGKTDELLRYPAGPKKGQVVSTSSAMKARQDVWDKAVPFVKNGIPVKDALDIALTWYKGANLEKDVERKVIKDLKKHETKLSAKRVGKRTVKVYEDEDERRAEVVREAARRAGIKGEFGT